MTSTRTTFPEILIGRSDPSWGDERERSILLDGYAYAYTLGAVSLWIVGAISAWFIPGWVTIALFAAIVVPAFEYTRYCRSRGVDVNRLTYARATTRRLVIVSVLTGMCAASMTCAVLVDLTPRHLTPSALIGAMIGGSVAFAANRLYARRADARDQQSIEDEF